MAIINSVQIFKSVHLDYERNPSINPFNIQPSQKIVVLDSDKPVVIMPTNNSIETTSIQQEMPEIEINTTLDKEDDIENDKEYDKEEEMDNIKNLLNQTKPKRDDGIELIINTDIDNDNNNESEKNESNNSSEKKTIKL